MEKSFTLFSIVQPEVGKFIIKDLKTVSIDRLLFDKTHLPFILMNILVQTQPDNFVYFYVQKQMAEQSNPEHVYQCSFKVT